MMHFRNQSVNVKRSDLLEALRKNRSLHIAEYKEALRDFRLKMKSELQRAAESLVVTTDDHLHKFKVQLPAAPSSHTRNYDEVIEMLELSVDETINLDSESFQAYFKNKWSWTDSFKTIAASYKAF